MKRHKHLFEHLASLDNLLEASWDALRGKRSKPVAARYFIEMEKEVVALHEELHSGSYRHGPYHYFTIHEPKARLVAAARFRDRVVHHALVRVLEPLFEPRFIGDSFACRPGKGTHAGMRRAADFARRFPYALKCDVQKYFPSIHQGILMEQVRRVIGDARVLDIVEEILGSHTDSVRPVWPEGRGLFDHREQPARLEPQQQHTHEREQQRGLPARKPLWQDGGNPSGELARFMAGGSRHDSARDRDYPFLQRAVIRGGRRRTKGPAAVSSASERRGWSRGLCEAHAAEVGLLKVPGHAAVSARRRAGPSVAGRDARNTHSRDDRVT